MWKVLIGRIESTVDTVIDWYRYFFLTTRYSRSSIFAVLHRWGLH